MRRDASVARCQGARADPFRVHPIGPIEWHGPHLRFGADGLHAYAVTVKRRVGGVVLPAYLRAPRRSVLPALARGASPARDSQAIAYGLSDFPVKESRLRGRGVSNDRGEWPNRFDNRTPQAGVMPGSVWRFGRRMQSRGSWAGSPLGGRQIRSGTPPPVQGLSGQASRRRKHLREARVPRTPGGWRSARDPPRNQFPILVEKRQAV